MPDATGWEGGAAAILGPDGAPVSRSVDGLEAHVLGVELPTGATVVGECWVWVLADGSLGCRIRCSTDRPDDRRAFAIVMGKALDDFRSKHSITDGDYIGRTRIVRSN